MLMQYIEALQNVSLFRGMSMDEISQTLSSMDTLVRKHPERNCICSQNETFSTIGIILKGKVQIVRKHITGDIASIHTLETYDTFGEDIICSGSTTTPYGIETLEKSILLYINSTELFYMDKNTSTFRSKFFLNIIKTVANRSFLLNAQVDYIRILSLKKRIATLLLDHYYNHGQNLFTIELSRAEMAKYLNATRPAVSKILAEFKKEGMIDYYRNSFKIYDVDRLSKQ
ncbi:cAMP-binding domain of CRP or a regulatory subunit of cAMP-dependent protein kinases [Anaerovirgula multivorans]|uniref:cAMP-binding domain of CRP or a regulatory subunit of cAMP-dependent protein kinases n=2 Tax=Anaerovirgula multivorans TaxID=312168 RepID=A0A239H746_9FIRM|nr:cAMP-binding domain of CRP or a regulatory subunit of cAMP-dependent protein kinases [Anaerovirgula multivorans]